MMLSEHSTLDAYTDVLTVCGKRDVASGKINLQGFKHLGVGILASTIACGCRVKVSNLPDILDIEILCQIIQQFNGTVIRDGEHAIIDTTSLSVEQVEPDILAQVHGTLYLVPALLGRFRSVELGPFGGCKIGSHNVKSERPIAHVCEVLERFGATMISVAGCIKGYCENFTACEIDIMDFSDYDDVLSGPHVSGATKTAIIAALNVKKGKTVIKNYYFKPDVLELLKFIMHLGFKVQIDENTISIEQGAGKVKNSAFRLLPDLSEIMTYITYAVYHEVPLKIVDPQIRDSLNGLNAELALLKEIGVDLQCNDEKGTLTVLPVKTIKSFSIRVTSVGIYSDHQPFFCLLALRANAASRIYEQVWKDRFAYVPELEKLGFKLKRQGNCLEVYPSKCKRKNGIELVGADLRSFVALAIAAIEIEEPVKIKGAHHLRRGYERFHQNIQLLGGNIYL